MLHFGIGPTAYVVWDSHVFSDRSSLNADNWCILTHNTLQHKHDVSITLTCWFEEINTNDFDHPLCSAICYFGFGRRYGSEPYMCIYMYTARDPDVEHMHPYHRLKTLRYGIGNALSNAIESHVPSSFRTNLIKFTWVFLE